MSDGAYPRESLPQDYHPFSPLRIRTMRPGDIAAGLRLCRASRWNQIRGDWELFLTLNPTGSLVAIAETGEIVGSVATIRYGNAFSWIAMVLVDPSRRQAGIGTRLLEEALTVLDGAPTARLDATPAGHDVYARIGFREEYGLHRMERRAPRAVAPSDVAGDPRADSPARRLEEEDLQDVFALDHEAFGASRAPLLKAFQHRTPEYAWVVGRRPIDGFVVGRHGHTFEHLGPLVARDEATARHLVSACLTAHPDRRFIMDIPGHGAWKGWLESLQFGVQRPFTRMYRGERRYRERLEWMFAIAGPEFG
jgi:predicted N-acetyltransferase YhbS